MKLNICDLLHDILVLILQNELALLVNDTDIKK
jgi:hypothetical protein